MDDEDDDLKEAMDLAHDMLTREDLRAELQVFARESLRNELRHWSIQVKQDLQSVIEEIQRSTPAASSSMMPAPSTPSSKHVTMSLPVCPPQSPSGTVGEVHTVPPGRVASPRATDSLQASYHVGQGLAMAVVDSLADSGYDSISRFDADEEGFGIGFRGYVVTTEMNFLQEQAERRTSITKGDGRAHASVRQSKASLTRSARHTRRKSGTVEPVEEEAEDAPRVSVASADFGERNDTHINPRAVSRNLADENWALPKPPASPSMAAAPPPLLPPAPPDEAHLAPLPGFGESRRGSFERQESSGGSSASDSSSRRAPGAVTVAEEDVEQDGRGCSKASIGSKPWRASLISTDSSVAFTESGQSAEPNAHPTTPHLKHVESDGAFHYFRTGQMPKAKKDVNARARFAAFLRSDVKENDQDSDDSSETSPIRQLLTRPSCCWRGASALLNNPKFEVVTTLLVFSNAITIGIQTDWAARNVTHSVPRIFQLLETFFCVCFSFELGVRLFVWQCQFFYHKDNWKWNLFDMIVVTVQVVEEVIGFVYNPIWIQTGGMEKEGLQTNFTALRIMRILRVIRIVRLVRILRLINELRTLVNSIVGTLKSLIWTCMLIFLMIYIVGVYLTQVVTEARVDLQDSTRAEDKSLDATFVLYYGTLTQSLLSLYQSISNGIDWAVMVSPLTDHIHPMLGLMFVAYIVFSTLAVFNVVTGVFVETALASAKEDKDVYMVNHLRNIFMSSDANRDGTIDWEEFESQLDNKQFREYFKAIDVDISEARGIFRLLDASDTGQIDAEEFLSGCLRLKGAAKSLDMNILLRETRRMSQMYKAHARWVERNMRHMNSVLPAVRQMQNLVSAQINTIARQENAKEEWLV